MTAVAMPGGLGLMHPVTPESLGGTSAAPAFDAAGLIDATGEKFAITGRVVWSDRGSHNIHTIGWRAGAITSVGGSGITISLQDASLTAGPPGQPDGTQDQTVSVLLSALSASAWNLNTLGADRTVAHGALLSVVWEYDVNGRLGADSLVITNLATQLVNSFTGHVPALYTTSWNSTAAIAVLVLVAADGTIGTLAGAVPWSAINTHAFNSGSAADELANQFQYPAPVTVEGVSALMTTASAADFSVILYSGTTALATVAQDNNAFALRASGNVAWKYFPFATPQALAKDTLYRIAFRPDTANNITLYSADVNAAGYLDLIAGQNFHYWDRVNAGAWANETTTRWLLIRLHLSQTDDGAGGGGLAHIIGG